MTNKKTNDLPVEVSLVNEVKSCHACSWFWGGIPPYGPYPSYDWKEPFPKAIREKLPQTMETEPVKWTTVEAVGDKLVEPAVLRGCRKAPIMTVGINPNLTAYGAYPKGARWTYPWFAKTGNYAYYYRHATIFQESLDLNVIKEHLVPGTECIGEGDGWLIRSQRCVNLRWLDVTVKYKDRDEPVHYEIAWTPEERAVVLLNSIDEKDIESTEPNIKKGEVFAGKLKSFKGTGVEVYENGTGYYQRLLPALKMFKEAVGTTGENSDLLMGEDVCLHDMVGCASPGWSSKYDMPRDRIANQCVVEKDFVMKQILQSRPNIVMVVSSSSLEMFANGLKKTGGELSFSYEDRDIYDLLKETCSTRQYVTFKRDGTEYKARVLATPHFSYPQNFVTQSRFSEEAWKAFKNEFPNDADVLEKKKRVQRKTFSGIIPIDIKGEDDSIKKKIGYTAWGILMARFYDPYGLIVNAFLDENRQGNLTIGEETGHFKRSEGDCAFCENSEWAFPEGCPYKKR
ncbi:MAG: hypothetical protein GY757_21935 [bacterium]|nr:hypothetical protein [bacterium]